jgi:hypothetical protein
MLVLLLLVLVLVLLPSLNKTRVLPRQHVVGSLNNLLHFLVSSTNLTGGKVKSHCCNSQGLEEHGC